METGQLPARMTAAWPWICTLAWLGSTRYSTRAAAAAAAAAVDGKFAQYHDVLYANQPAENSDGLTDSKLVDLSKVVGLGDTFAAAVNTRMYDAWAGHVTDTFSARGYTGTPTIVVAGKVVEGPGHQLFVRIRRVTCLSDRSVNPAG